MKTVKKILIADESNVTQHILASAFIKAGYIIRTVSSDAELKNLFRMESVDLIMLSQSFSEGNPCEMIRYIRKTIPNCKVYLMATSLSIAETVELMKAGAVDCFVKPFDTATLLKKTQQLFETEEKAGQLYRSEHDGESSVHFKQKEPDTSTERNPIMQNIENIVRSIRDYRVNVIITGEVGTGKANYARKIHLGAATRCAPFVAFNCESELADDMEKLLFGEENSAGKELIKGKMELADNGTLYIQELDKMPLTLQSKLVTVLQEGRFEVRGSGRIVPFHARLISTMTITPEHAMASGKIRPDLYYQISEVRLDLPPLRTCKDRIPDLTRYFLRDLSRETSIPIPQVDNSFWDALASYDWPGNVIELFNTVKRCFLIAHGKELTSSLLPISILQSYSKESTPKQTADDYLDLRDYLKAREREMILQTLDKFGGNRIKTAKYLRISERSLRYKLEEYMKLDDSV